MNRVPLAEQMRPKNLKDVIGQSHLLGKTEILSSDSKELANSAIGIFFVFE